MDEAAQKEIAKQIALRFIQRRDTYALQKFMSGTQDYGYAPVQSYDTNSNPLPATRQPITLPVLLDHLSGKKTVGHYLLDDQDKCRLFAFDIDLEPTGEWLELPTPDDPAWHSENFDFAAACQTHAYSPREAWRDRSHPSRPWVKNKLRMLAWELVAGIRKELDLPCAVAYSGYKGLHVYGFTGQMAASDVREGAQIVLDALNCFVPIRGDNFFRHKDNLPFSGYPGFSIEVFPKQTSLADKDLGNLMRLPLGRNLKAKDPTFFVDITKPGLTPLDPMHALTVLNPFLAPEDVA